MINLAQHAARELRRVGVRIDWKATFDAFVELHGGLPVRHGGRLLFADGWGHALDYRGPEFRPPEDPDQLHHLKLVYQHEKRRMLVMERNWLEGAVGSFDEAQRLRSAPLQRRYRTGETDEMGNPKWGTGPAAEGVEPLRMRLRWARQELRDCEAEISRMDGSSGLEHAEKTA